MSQMGDVGLRTGGDESKTLKPRAKTKKWNEQFLFGVANGGGDI
ncbi:MAG: hypothetical protein QOK20_1879 [Acidimicrobiaceae bacterium]|nr:hypothetical protein [Acidimicrobiaceae bacterium]